MSISLYTIKKSHLHIVDLVTRKKVNEAIGELCEYMSSINNWDLQNEIEEIENTYLSILDYLRQDIADPQRMEMHEKVIRDILSMADRVQHQLVSKNEKSTQYLNTIKKLNSLPKPPVLEDILLELESYTENYAVAALLNADETNQLESLSIHHEEVQTLMFETIWTSMSWNIDEEAAAKRILDSVLISTYDLCLFVSAVTLSLIESFDLKKLMLLFDAYTHKSNLVNQRALVGLTIMFELYHNRLPYYHEVTARLAYLNENPSFSRNLNRVIIQILLSKDTEKVNQKMQEEIIPEMIKSVHSNNFRINPDENEEDFNPDWAENLDNSSFGDKLREMSELQMEGADVYMSTFAYHKGYPFFNPINNWFYPFDKQHSLVMKEMKKGTESKLIDLILQTAYFCDSDKYSLLFTIMQIPAQHRDMMTRQMSEEIDSLRDEETSKSMKAVANSTELIANQYIHNLYRFFKVYRVRSEFLDIFNLPYLQYQYPLLKPYIYKPQLLKELVDFLFRKERYSEAAEICNSLITLEGDNAEVYQRLGYCYQREKEYKKAIKAYTKADVLKPDNLWTNRHMATCYRKLQEYAFAMVYYKKVEEVQPENLSLLYNMGSCLVELEFYEEALQYFFKLDFIEPDNTKTWHAIGWCSFMLKKFEQAMKYYTKIIKSGGSSQDYLNAGHITWCLGNRKSALAHYQKAYELWNDRASFYQTFNEDTKYLLENGINEYEICLMIDLISFTISPYNS